MNEKNPTLCIVAGPNGSGKTSTTVQLLHNEWAENSLYINPDNIADIIAIPTVPKSHFLHLSFLVIYCFKFSVPGIIQALV